MTKLIMHGCNGKMGQVISKIVKEDPNVEMAAGIDAYTGIANDYPVFESIEKCDIKADAIIDFSQKCLHQRGLTLRLSKNIIIRKWMRRAELHLQWRIRSMKHWTMNTVILMTEARCVKNVRKRRLEFQQ